MSDPRPQTILPAASLRPLLAATRLLPALLLVLLTAPGCKTGTATSKPSWWAFGGSDSAKLASAPAYEKGAIEKPSATQNPYPVTSTPKPYSLTAATQSAPAADVATTPPAVTYGTTPAPARAQPVPVAAAAVPEPAQTAGARQQPPLASIAPQVGPYTQLPGETAAGAGAIDAGGDRFRGTPPDRYADARPADSWSVPAAPSQPAAGSRYGDVPGSRFTDAQPPAEIPLQGVQPAATTAPAVSARQAGFSAADPAAASGPLPGGSGYGPGAAFDPAAAPAASPALTPSPATPVPQRRTDPFYRPAGTSSYRPGREILVGTGAEADPAVRQVNFETPPAAN